MRATLSFVLAAALTVPFALGTSALEALPPAADVDPLGCVADVHPGRIRACRLDADFLDGVDASGFAPAQHHHDGRYLTPEEADARFMRADTRVFGPGSPVEVRGADLIVEGHVGIGSSTPEAPLDVAGTVRAQRLQAKPLAGCARLVADDAGVVACGDPAVTSFTSGGKTYTVTARGVWAGNGHTYLQVIADGLCGLCGDGITWLEARDAARLLGGHLATFTSAEEVAFVVEHVYSVPYLAIGLTDVRQEGTFEWVTGEIAPVGTGLVFSDWAEGEPNDQGGEDFAVFWNIPYNGWADSNLTPQLEGFLAELAPFQSGG